MIPHDKAIELENIVSKLFNCQRYDFNGLINSDFFEEHPFDAAIMILSYLYAKKPNDSITKSIMNYKDIFHDEKLKGDDFKEKVTEYIDELKGIVNNYVSTGLEVCVANNSNL